MGKRTGINRRHWEPIHRGGEVLIPLTQGEVAVIDVADLPLVREYAWRVQRGRHTSYAVTEVRPNGKPVSLLMHRVILNLDRDDARVPDHIDRDGLNNRRSNLRAATNSQNLANKPPAPGGTSRFKGVCWFKGTSRWAASLSIDNGNRHLGYFLDEVAAARAYDLAALAEYGEFAWLNFPIERLERS